MTTYTVEKTFQWRGCITEKVCSVMRMFGLDADRLRDSGVTHKCRVNLSPGQVCYITGASGAGKSVILRQLYEQAPAEDKLRLDDIPLEADKTVVDCIEGEVFDSLGLLSKAGLSDVFCVLNQPVNLSDGQQYRYQLARAFASGKKMIFADEFCSNLDRVTAAVIAYKVRQFASRTGTTFILAGSHDDMLCDLGPDVIVIKHLAGKTEVIYSKK